MQRQPWRVHERVRERRRVLGGGAAAGAYHGSGVEDDCDHFGPGELTFPGLLFLHDILNPLQPPPVAHVGFGLVAVYDDGPLGFGRRSDLVVGGDQLLVTVETAAVLNLHFLLKFEMRRPCSRSDE